MKIAILMSSFVALAAATTPVSYRNFKAYNVEINHDSHVRFLLDLDQRLDMDVWTSVQKGKEATVMVGPDVAATLTEELDGAGIGHSIMSSNVQELIDASPKMAPYKSAAEGEYNMNWDDYQSLETIYDYLDYLEVNFETVSTEVIGHSYEGLPMKVVKICSGECGSKPAMFIEGTIHAREWMSPMVVTYMIRELTENVHNHRDLVADLDWYILPVTNPDGYVYSVVDRMWRKTRSPNDGSACTGTDANRNFDYAFGQLPGASDSPCSDAYHGAEAFSEVEIANVRDFILRHKDQIKFFNDMHAAASMVLLPWGYTDERTDDYIDQMNFFTEAANALHEVHGTRYSVGQIPELLYEVSGGSTDWTYGTVGIKYTCAIELRDGFLFWPPPETIVMEGEEIWAFHKSAAYQIMAKYGGA